MVARFQQGLEGYAASGQNGSNSVTATPYRATLSGGDSANLTAPLSAGSLLVTVGGRTTGYVTASFGTASATSVVVVVFYAQSGSSTGAVIGHVNLTLVADATLTRDGTRFDAIPIPFDLIGTNYEIRAVAAPSAGNVSLFTWVE